MPSYCWFSFLKISCIIFINVLKLISFCPKLRYCALDLYFQAMRSIVSEKRRSVCNIIPMVITICLAYLSTAISTFLLQELMTSAIFWSKNAEISISCVSSSLTSGMHELLSFSGFACPIQYILQGVVFYTQLTISRNIHIIECGLIYNKEHLKRWSQDSFGNAQQIKTKYLFSLILQNTVKKYFNR